MSTLLQRYVFGRHEQINLIKDNDVNGFLNSLVGGDASVNVKEIEEFLNQRITQAGNGKDVFSHEKFSGYMHSSEGNFYILERISKVFDPEIILVVLKDPSSYIYSAWSHYIREGGILSLQRYLRSPASPGNTKYSSIIKKVAYSHFIKKLYEFFDKAKIHIILYEDFKNDYQSILNELFYHMGIDNFSLEIPNIRPQQSLSIKGNKLKMAANNVFFTKHNCHIAAVFGKNMHTKLRSKFQKFFPLSSEVASIPEYVISHLNEDEKAYIKESNVNGCSSFGTT